MKLCGLICVLCVMATSASASEKVSVDVTPSVSFAPANVVIRAMVPTDKKNRAIEIVAESPDFYRSSQVQLDGENAPVLTVCEFQSLPPGMYKVTVVVKGSGDRSLARAFRQVNVISPGGDEPPNR